MKHTYRLLTLLLVLPFLAGTSSFVGNPLADSATSEVAVDTPVLSVISPSGKTVDFYRIDSGWEPVSAEQLAGLSDEVNAIPESILNQINTATVLESTAGEDGWFCEVVKHDGGPWTWNCWRDS
jgi:hypothetical protein